MRHVLLALVTSALVFGAQVPRPSPDFAFTLPDGQKKLLSSYKGQVIAVSIMSPT